MKKALGLIETIGFVAAVEAADAAVKAANVVLLGYDSARAGKITIKVAGDVGAVQAAVAAGVAAASRVGTVYGSLVIPRPHEEIDPLIQQAAGKQPPPRSQPPHKPHPPTEIEGEPAEEEAAPAQPLPAEPDSAPEAAAPESPSEAVAGGVAAEAAVAKRCIAITKAGVPCKLPARPGSDYCVFHRKLEGKTADSAA